VPAAFKELLPNAGVDEDRNPTGMIIPLGGTNLVRFDGGSGYKLAIPGALNFEILKPKDALLALKALATAQNVSAPVLPAGSSVCRVSASGAPRDLKITATKPGAKAPEATLEVSVLKPKKVNLEIKPIQIHDPADPKNLIFHCSEPADPKTIAALVAQMNEVWTPQANVEFVLVSSTPFLPDDKDIAAALGLKASSAPLPERVDFPAFVNLFNSKGKDKSEDFAMFLVGKATDNRDYTDAVTSRAAPVSLISDSRKRLPDMLAHEAGHLLGFRGHSDNAKELMHDGGSKIDKITYEQAVRTFNHK
jgi:hypothetical protein